MANSKIILLLISLLITGRSISAVQPGQGQVIVFYQGPQTNSSADFLRTMQIAVGATLVVGAGYLTGRALSWCIYKYALYTYEPELDLLNRAQFNDYLIEQELMPYILEQHDRNNRFFFGSNPYKNYPLLKYKQDLDWYVMSLWLFKLFYLGADKSSEISLLIQKLERIRRYVVTDYGFVKEQRDFDRNNRKKREA